MEAIEAACWARKWYVSHVSVHTSYPSSHPRILDVTDVAWSPGDRYLASVGLDSAVLVWCGFTLGEWHPLLVARAPVHRHRRTTAQD